MRGADDVIVYQIRQSFAPGEITPEEANRLGCELAGRFTKGNHAYVVCTHIDKAHIHNHIIWNAVDLGCARKFLNFWGSTRTVRRLNDTICIENGYSIVEQPKPRGKSYGEWLGDAEKLPHRERLRLCIDNALSQGPATWETFLELLRKEGYEIKNGDGKNPSFWREGQKRFVRLDTLGEGYAKEALLAVLAGEKEHVTAPPKRDTPKRKQRQSTPQPERSAFKTEPVNLLVDIQKKLQEGKGGGYARWAKTFNLKQMAKTMNYLTEHHLLEYSALEQKAADATARYQELCGQIKVAEKRMEEITALKKQIVTYARTREVYVAYREAGYAKKFLAEHEAEILLHKAAKKAFDELGVKKLPTTKELQEEYAKLAAEKKTLYGAYREARTEMRELLTVKENVDQLIENGEGKEGKEREQEEQR